MTGALTMTLGEALGLAERYAERGVAVFPIAVSWNDEKGKCDKRPLNDHGHLSASTDRKQIRFQFNTATPRNGEALGVGLHLGSAGWFALDGDVFDGGLEELAAIESRFGVPGDTVRVATASGGVHVWLSSIGRHVSNAEPFNDVDVRGDDGWIVAPGTCTPWGEWSFSDGHNLFDGAEVADAPAGLLDHLGAGAKGEAKPKSGRTLDREALDVRDRACLEAAELLGGTFSHQSKDVLYVTRKGKTAGASMSIGYVGPGIAKVFTKKWPPLEHLGVYDADHLAAIAAGTVPASDTDVSAPDAEQTNDGTPSSPEPYRIRTGAEFVLDRDHRVRSVWGQGDEVLWARGESLIICGPPGVGKTTTTVQVIGARMGLTPDVLGWNVEPLEGDERILYLALDRPNQISRAMARVFTNEHRDMLNRHLVVWDRPLPRKVNKDPGIIRQIAAEYGCSTVVIDSIKDIASKLTDDESGIAINDSMSYCVSTGIDVLALHHQRKGQDGRKPTKLDDVYGSAFITAGAGSVMLLWGEAGDSIVELSHLKPPAEKIGPLKVEHDHLAGTSKLVGQIDVVQFVRNFTNGATRTDLARSITGQAAPAERDLKRAGRLLDKAVANHALRKVDGERGGIDGATPTRYFVEVLW